MPAISITSDVDALTGSQLAGGFFEGWPNPPTPEDHLRILHGSWLALVAIREDQVVGFVTVISDGVCSAYIPLLEVLPAYRGQGVATRLIQEVLARTKDQYMLDLSCDPQLQAFYERLGFRPLLGMGRRNYDRQSCRPVPTFRS